MRVTLDIELFKEIGPDQSWEAILEAIRYKTGGPLRVLTGDGITYYDLVPHNFRNRVENDPTTRTQVDPDLDAGPGPEEDLTTGGIATLPGGHRP